MVSYFSILTSIGGHNATALTKFIQFEQTDIPDSEAWRMALVSQEGKYVIPQAYLGVTHEHIKPLGLLSGTVTSQVENWSKTDVGARVVKYLPNENKVVLSNGKEYTYKALVLAPGLNHRSDVIEGLDEMANGPEEDYVFLHMLDSKERADRNY